MTKLTFRCLECGFSKEILGNNDDANDDVNKYCPVCESALELQNADSSNDERSIAHIVKLDSIEQMRGHIQELGSERVWAIIEGFDEVKTRLAYRKIFFEGGGIVPNEGVKK